MFKKKANITFDNYTPDCWMIGSMEEDLKQPSAQAGRLFQAAKELRGIDVYKWGGKSALARLLNIDPQAITNWAGGRPISNEALLKIQQEIGCDAIWVRDGVGEMTRNHASLVQLSPQAKLLDLFEKSTDRGRGLILDIAETAEKRSGISVIAKPRKG